MKARLGECFSTNAHKETQLQKDIIRALFGGRRVLDDSKPRIIERKENEFRICEIKREDQKIKKRKKVPKISQKSKGRALRNLSPLREEEYLKTSLYENIGVENKFSDENHYYHENTNCKPFEKKIEAMTLSYPETTPGEKIDDSKELFGQIKTGVDMLEKENKRITMMFEEFIAKNNKINKGIEDLLSESDPIEHLDCDNHFEPAEHIEYTGPLESSEHVKSNEYVGRMERIERIERIEYIERLEYVEPVREYLKMSEEKYVQKKASVESSFIAREERDYDYKVSW